MMKRNFLVLFLALSASGVSAQTARSGNGGAVLGRVFELGGSPVARATVTARNQENGSEKTGITAADGTFFISPLAPGQYSIKATGAGFRENVLSEYPVRLTTAAGAVKIGLVRIGGGQESPTPQAVISRQGADQDPSSLEVRVRWDAAAGTGLTTQGLRPSTVADHFSLVETRQTNGSMPRQRMPELSTFQILVVFTDEQGEQEDWALIPDPRIIRAESPGPNGELSGQVIYRSDAEFLVPCPAALSPAGLKFYQPRWTGREFALDLLGMLATR